MMLLAKLALGLIVGYCAILLGLYIGQRSLMYHPDSARIKPAATGLTAVVERELQAKDGTKLIAWHSKTAKGQPTIVYFHGNAGTLADRARRINEMQARGWGVFILGYRGYSGSGGAPSEAANMSDAEMVLATLAAEGVPLPSIILYGESLGSGIAAQMAYRHQDVAGLILDSPFTSMADAAAYHYPWIWVRPFVKDRYDTARIIDKIKCPILILHGELDQVVPLAMGRKLADIAGAKARLVTFKHGHHTDLYDHGALDDIGRFIAALRQAPAMPAAER